MGFKGRSRNWRVPETVERGGGGRIVTVTGDGRILTDVVGDGEHDSGSMAKNPFGPPGDGKVTGRKRGSKRRFLVLPHLDKLRLRNWQRHSQQPKLLQELSSIVFREAVLAACASMSALSALMSDSITNVQAT